jgi:hypothetical protein
MKIFIRNLVMLSCVGGSVWAAPFCAIGNNAELFVTGQAGVRFDDNILLAPGGTNQKSDTIVSFTPGLELEFGKDSLVKGVLSVSESFSDYLSHSELNSQLGTLNFKAAYNTEKTKLAANAAYTESDQNSYAANGSNIRRNTYLGGLDGEYTLSPKTSFGTGVNLSRTEYLQSGSVGEKNYGVPVNVYYGITPKTDLSAGVTYGRSDLDNGLSYDDFYYNVGARGEFTPKLNGSFSIGWDDRTGSGGPLAQNNSSLGFRSGLTYIYSDKTTIMLNADKGFSNASSGSSTQKNLGIVLGAQSDLATNWKVNTSLAYRDIQYEGVAAAGRVDDYLEASLGATYIVNSNISLNGTYTYRNLYSNVPNVEFGNSVIAVSVSARY